MEDVTRYKLEVARTRATGWWSKASRWALTSSAIFRDRTCAGCSKQRAQGAAIAYALNNRAASAMLHRVLGWERGPHLLR